MADALTLYLLAVAGTVAFFFAAFVYYEAAATPGQTLARKGLSPRGVTAAVVVTFGVTAVLTFLGTTPPPLGDAFEGFAYTVLGWGLVVLFGLLGVQSAYTRGRRWRRLHPDNDVPTGRVEPGTTACTGAVTDAATGTAPVTGREAVCWSWSVEVLDPHGVSEVGQRERWDVVAGDAGGVRFALDDGSGPVWVDPGEATLDLDAERTVALDEGETPPASFQVPAPDVERTHGDRPREYTERVLAPGDSAVVAGTARATDDDGLVVAGPDAHVAVGTLATAATRYRNRAAMYVLAGLAGIAVGVWGLAGTVGVL